MTSQSLDKKKVLSLDKIIPYEYLKKEITGEIFNKLAAKRKLYKLINKETIHNGLKLIPNALNVDHKSFDPTYECSPGGIYFCEKQNIHLYCDFKRSDDSKFVAYYYAKVSIPSDARVYIEHYKIKADKIHLSIYGMIEK